jgi:Fic family protein
MSWNWQDENWPEFRYDKERMAELENRFLTESGVMLGAVKHIDEAERESLAVELISLEALKTSEIEGEILNRESLQSSIRRHFGLKADNRKIPRAEQGIAEMMVDVYRDWSSVLSNETLFRWHNMLAGGRSDLACIGCYRSTPEAMQVVSGSLSRTRVHFEAPPSEIVCEEMNRFMNWFNGSAPGKPDALPALTRAAIAHLYFVTIHPFEDGNGRIARAVSEKSLSQNLNRSTLIALARTVEANRKAYYDALERVNRRIEITDWLVYFGETILAAQQYTIECVEHIIKKCRFYDKYGDLMNSRQHKVIARMFREGLEGFRGGLSAENYISITRTSPSTATRDLQGLVAMNALIRNGRRNYTRYALNL